LVFLAIALSSCGRTELEALETRDAQADSSFNAGSNAGQCNGTWGFATQHLYVAGNRPRSVAVGDFNRDGFNDLAVVNMFDGTVGVYLNKGAGAFPPVSYSCAAPVALAVGDFNRDGFADLAVVNTAGTNSVGVMFNQKNGTFAPEVQYATGTYGSAVAVGDFNGDGAPDLAVTSQNDYAVSVHLNKGDGSFLA